MNPGKRQSVRYFSLSLEDKQLLFDRQLSLFVRFAGPAGMEQMWETCALLFSTMQSNGHKLEILLADNSSEIIFDGFRVFSSTGSAKQIL